MWLLLHCALTDHRNIAGYMNYYQISQDNVEALYAARNKLEACACKPR